jgi:hypothetical protein
MKPAEVRIREAINAHIALTEAYMAITTEIESKGRVFCWEKETANTNSAATHERARYILLTIRMCVLCLAWWKDIEPQKSYIFRPYVEYLLADHIRRQYQKLYRLYLAQLLLQRELKKISPKPDLDKLREIASDVKEYSRTLPSLAKINSLQVALPIVATVFTIFSISFTLPDISIFLRTTQDILVVLAIAIVIAFIVYTIVLSPYIAAFHFKRFLFKEKDSEDFPLSLAPLLITNTLSIILFMAKQI